MRPPWATSQPGAVRHPLMITRRHLLAGTGALATLSITRPPAAQASPPAIDPRSATMEIIRNGSQPSRKGPEDYFTGAVRIDPLYAPPEPARASAGRVTFEPGARTAWHP